MAIQTPNMPLIQPVVGADSGLVWENAMNTNATTVDQHDHSSGRGRLITPSGMNINSDLSMNSSNLTLARSVRFAPQLSPISGASDLSCVFVSGVDLFYKDSNGVNIQMTASGAVNATTSGISNGTATASFVSSVLTVLSAVNTPAAIRGGSYLMGNTGTLSSNYLTLNPPAAMGLNYSLTLPSLPSGLSIPTIDTAGNMGYTQTSVSANPVALAMNSTGANAIAASMNATGVNAIASTMFGAGSGIVPTGTVLPFAGAYASIPVGFLACNGASALRTDYPNLFAVIGTFYGAVDGSHFNVPDLLNKAPFGYGGRFGIAQSGGFLDPSTSTLADHTHGLTQSSHTHNYAHNADTTMGTGGNGPPVSFGLNTPSTSTTASTITISVNTTGTGVTNGNMPPFLAMVYMIKY